MKYLGFGAAIVIFTFLLGLCIKCLWTVYAKSFKENNKISYSDLFIAIGVSIEACFNVLELSSIKFDPIARIVISAPTRITAVLSWMISTAAFMMYIIRMCPYFDINVSKRFKKPILNSKMLNFLILMVICVSSLLYLLTEVQFTPFVNLNPLLILSFFNIGGIPISYNLIVFTLLCFILTNVIISNHFTYFLGRQQDASYFLFVVSFTSRLGLRFNCFSFNQGNQSIMSMIYQVLFGLSYALLSYFMYSSLITFIKSKRG